ncbi:hypothetical protein QR680_003927 [Steinernema hermaphroditum]|uniref:Probable D-lactate dehydrogenase, mitochondrial n=1 Tax=Steinernema hermaphroditum TaxID=289476 RepID=A0AA39HN51_9BILA|nr:hypothetical protein QR680_003927 [Steinernema hermaphroditum]
MLRGNALRRCFSSGSLKNVTEELIPKLESILGVENVKTSASVREHYGHDESHFRNYPPDVVVTPQCVEQVSEVAKFANDRRVPLIPFGTGTGIEGGVNAIRGGICMDLKAMDEIKELSVENFDCVVQPGVTRKALNNFLRDTGLWFSVDPGADASVCGMVATGASGTNTVRYGTIIDNVRNLEVVLADGTILGGTRGKGRRPRKSSAGYNLTQLFVGSEGTLGVITSACVKLHARPAFISAAVCAFPDVKSAVQSVVETLQRSIPIARIEFLDSAQIEACNSYSNLNMAKAPTLFLEFHGSAESEVAQQAQFVEDICHSNKGSDFKWSTEQDEMNRLWTARHNAWYAALSQRPGRRGFSTDVCVPISHLARVVDETRKDIDASGVFGTIVGHVGDGNFHCIFCVDEEDPKERAAVQQLSDNVVKRALAVGGTCTGEHGIGMGKVNYLKEELGESTLNVMKALKRTLDPNGILNPGKVLDM